MPKETKEFTFTLEAWVDHEESKDITQKFYLPDGYRIVEVAQPQLRHCLGHSYFTEIRPENNCLVVIAHVQGKGVAARLPLGIKLYNGRGCILADIKVRAERVIL